MSEQRNCPTCESPGKHLHPAVQHEGEVQICQDPWHRMTTPLTREQVEKSLDKVAEVYEWKHVINYLREHDAALRATIAQQAQDLQSVKEERARWYGVAQRQAQEIERLKKDLAYSDKSAKDAEERHKQILQHQRETLTKYSDGLAQQLATMTKERDEAVKNAESNLAIMIEQGTSLNDYARQLATAQARVTEAQAECRRIEVLNAQLQATLAEREARIAELEADRSIKMNGARLLARYVVSNLKKTRNHTDGEILSAAKSFIASEVPSTTPWLLQMMEVARVDKQDLPQQLFQSNKERDAVRQDAERLREALAALYAVQNGCPLPTYRKDWDAAMELVQLALRITSPSSPQSP